jgi:hypothetical protein
MKTTKPSASTPKVKMTYQQAPMCGSAKVPASAQKTNPARRNRDYTPAKSKGR